MEIKQVYEIVNSLTRQATGEDALTLTDATDLISLGDAVLSSDTSVDNFTGKLVDVIGKTVFTNRDYTPSALSLMMDTFEYGAVLQKITFKLADAEESKHWNLVNGSSIDPYKISTPEVIQKLYSNVDTFEIPVTIPDFQVKSAFKSPEDMAGFISGIYLNIRNSINLKLENLARLCYSNMIAERIKYKNANPTSQVVINLLEEYNKTVTTPILAADALNNADFLKFTSVTISNLKSYYTSFSKNYNDGSTETFTPESELIVTLLLEFASNYKVHLESNTFHKEIVELPKYTEIPFWQAVDDKSSISLTSSSGTTISQTGIIGILADSSAMGMTMYNQRTTSQRNNHGEYTNVWEKGDMGYYNDLLQNTTVLLIEDPPPLPL